LRFLHRRRWTRRGVAAEGCAGRDRRIRRRRAGAGLVSGRRAVSGGGEATSANPAGWVASRGRALSGEFTVPGDKSISHRAVMFGARSEEHTSELQSRENIVCRLLLEKKKSNK